MATGTTRSFDELHDQLGARGKNLQATASNLARLATMAEQFAHSTKNLKGDEGEYEGSRQYLMPLSDDKFMSSSSTAQTFDQSTITETCVESSCEVESWLSDVDFMNFNGEVVNKKMLFNAEAIGLFFSASWHCQDSKSKLLKFYNKLKKKGKKFEVIYISNDRSSKEMMQYLSNDGVPWVALPYDCALGQKLKEDFNQDSETPQLAILTPDGCILDYDAMDAVCGASAKSCNAVKEFTKWLERKNADSATFPTKKTGAKGIIKQIKEKLISDDTQKFEKILKEKDDMIDSLAQNQAVLNNEVTFLKNQLSIMQSELTRVREEDKKFKEELKLQGWLFKRGVKGPTGEKWRRRYFKVEQGSKIAYYKSELGGLPKGFINLYKVRDVHELPEEQQNSSNSLFNIVCIGRTYEMRANDKDTMEKWISAIKYLKTLYVDESSDDEST